MLDIKVGVLNQTEDGTVDGDIVGPAVETTLGTAPGVTL